MPFGVEIDPIMYTESNRKSVAASSLLWFTPYFHIRFGGKWLSETVFRRKCALNRPFWLVDLPGGVRGYGDGWGTPPLDSDHAK